MNSKAILVTAGAGFFGHQFAPIVLNRYKPSKLIIFSRDEQNQSERRRICPSDHFRSVHFFIGDVLDKDRLRRAFEYRVHFARFSSLNTWQRKKCSGGKFYPEKYCYSSDKIDRWFSMDELRKLVSSSMVPHRDVS